MDREKVRSHNNQLKRERQLRGWSQAEVASRLGSDAKSVLRWEANTSFPTPYYRQKLCELFGKTAEELGLLEDDDSESGNLMDQQGLNKLPLNRNPMAKDNPLTFGTLLRGYRHRMDLSQEELAAKAGLSKHYIGILERDMRLPSHSLAVSLAQTLGLSQQERDQFIVSALTRHTTKINWGEAPFTEVFYGREYELAELEQWIISNHCRLVAVLGFGGIGKTAISTKLVERIKERFEYVFWRSLQNAPPLENFLKNCIQFFSHQPQIDLPESIDDQIMLLIEHLRDHRCLLVLDNAETILQGGRRAGEYREGYEGYGRLLRLIGETNHKSCLLLTSREKLKEVAHLEGKASPVRSLPLSGIEQPAVQEMLKDRGLFGSDVEWAELVARYSGNPLALQVVSEPIQEVFGGDIARFLREEVSAFGDVSDLLDQHFHRLSNEEREIMYWLAIEREPVSLDNLRENVVHPVSKEELFIAIGSMRRRSMIEISNTVSFTLQPVIMEYVTNGFVNQISKEIGAEQISLFESHALIKADAKEYVRESQIRLILVPLAQRLLNALGKERTEKKLNSILLALHEMQPLKTGYAAGNILNLLLHLKSDLRSYNFSHLTIRQAYLQYANLQEVNFTEATFSRSVFSETFGNVLCTAWSPDGKLFAVGTANWEILMWHIPSGTLLQTYNGHTDWVRSLAFSPDGSIIASSSDDQTVRLWDVSSGQCLQTLLGHDSRVYSIAFSPDGHTLASGSEDQTVRLWDVDSGRYLQRLIGHADRVRSVIFNPDGRTLASGSSDCTVRLWDVVSGQCLRVLQGHTNWIRSVAFSPDGHMLASGSEDQTVRLWDVVSGQCLQTLLGHYGWIYSVAFSPDGHMLASGSDDQTVRLWDVDSVQCLRVLQGHINWIRSVAFSPDGHTLASGSEDQTVRLWDVDSAQCLRVLQGHTDRVRPVAFSPDGHTLASGSEDQTVRLWDVDSAQCFLVLQGHTDEVWSIAFSPDGHRLASGSSDYTIRLWDVSSGQCLQILQGHNSRVYSVAYNFDGSTIASSSDGTIKLWNVETGKCFQTWDSKPYHLMKIANVKGLTEAQKATLKALGAIERG